MDRTPQSTSDLVKPVHVATQEKRVLFVSNVNSPFVRNDVELLRKHFSLKTVEFGVGPRELGKSIKALYLMVSGLVWAHLAFSWFGGRHSLWTVLLSKLMGKKSIVVVGGFEVARIPEIRYGAALNPVTARFTKWILANASKVLTVDESLKREAISNLGASESNITTIPTGYDSKRFKPRGRKENTVLTVGMFGPGHSPKRKGLDVFVETARYLKEFSFVHVGYLSPHFKALEQNACRNVSFVGQVEDAELLRHYQRARVYCQLSLYEGLPNALCEAMLCECVPVGTRRGGIPTAIGSAGFYVPYGDAYATAKVIRKAIASDKGTKARRRIKSLFSLKTRERKVVNAISELLRLVAATILLLSYRRQDRKEDIAKSRVERTYCAEHR